MPGESVQSTCIFEMKISIFGASVSAFVTQEDMFFFKSKHAMEFITIKNTDCLYFTIRWMPESARWLIANGKLEQAQMYLKKCAKMNQAEKSVDKLKTEVSLHSR